jgi:hypothetical protein
MQALLCSRRIPGPTSFWEVVVIAPEQAFVRKVFSRSLSVSLHPDNKAQRLSGSGATRYFFLFRMAKTGMDELDFSAWT